MSDQLVLPDVGLAADEALFAFPAVAAPAHGSAVAGAAFVVGPVVQAGLFFIGLVGGVLTAWGITEHQQAQQDRADALHDAFHDAMFGAIRGAHDQPDIAAGLPNPPPQLHQPVDGGIF